MVLVKISAQPMVYCINMKCQQGKQGQCDVPSKTTVYLFYWLNVLIALVVYHFIVGIMQNSM